MLGYYAVVAVATGALLVWAAGQPHATAANEEESSTAPVTTTLAPGQATAHFPPAEIAKFRTIAQDTLAKVQAGDHTEATARIKDLETAWDDDQATLRPLDETAWTRPRRSDRQRPQGVAGQQTRPRDRDADSHRTIDRAAVSNRRKHARGVVTLVAARHHEKLTLACEIRVQPWLSCVNYNSVIRRT